MNLRVRQHQPNNPRDLLEVRKEYHDAVQHSTTCRHRMQHMMLTHHRRDRELALALELREEWNYQ
jgi:hypothetical protein